MTGFSYTEIKYLLTVSETARVLKIDLQYKCNTKKE